MRLPLFVAAIALTLFMACESTPDVNHTSNATTLTLANNSIEAAAAGGDYTVGYELLNGINGIDPVVISDQDWVTGVCKNGTIILSVESNTTTELREAIVEVRYPEVDPAPTIVVKQQGDSREHFTFTIGEMTSTSCDTTITPLDKEMVYIVYMSEVTYFEQMGITTTEQLFEDDYNSFVGFAKEYLTDDTMHLLKEFMLMNALAFEGESSITWSSMMPSHEYILYAYGIEFTEDGKDYRLATPVSYELIVLPENKLATVEFDVNITVNGPEVFYEFSPIDWEGGYYIDIYSEHDAMYRKEGELPNDEFTRAVVEQWLQQISMYMSMGYSAETLMDIMLLHGPDSYHETREADTNYMMVFYAVDLLDGIPQVISAPHVEYFRTGVVEQSDMTIDIQVENVYTRVADVAITPTTNDPYAIALVLKSDVPEGSDSDILNWLTGTFGLSTYQGTVVSHLNTLDPETEYTILAFGYFGGVITTDLYRADFKTEAEGICENSVVGIEHCGPYSPMDLHEVDPEFFFSPDMAAMYEQMGYYMMWVEVATEQPTQDLFCIHFDMQELASLGIDGLFNEVTRYDSEPLQVLAGMSNVDFVLCAVAMDYRGNYSDVFISEPFKYEYNASTKRPISELVEKLTSDTRAGRLVMVGAPKAERTPSYVYIK